MMYPSQRRKGNDSRNICRYMQWVSRSSKPMQLFIAKEIPYLPWKVRRVVPQATGLTEETHEEKWKRKCVRLVLTILKKSLMQPDSACCSVQMIEESNYFHREKVIKVGSLEQCPPLTFEYFHRGKWVRYRLKASMVWPVISLLCNALLGAGVFTKSMVVF